MVAIGFVLCCSPDKLPPPLPLTDSAGLIRGLIGGLVAMAVVIMVVAVVAAVGIWKLRQENI